MKNYLEFEKEIKSLEEEVDALKSPFGSEGISEVNTTKIQEIEEQINIKLQETYASLNSWQRTLVARHEDRPRANFYINKIFSNFTALSGDRYFGDDKSIIAGFGLIDSKSVLVLGQEKGEDLNSRIERNFGMMRPEGYRKCIRLMKLANKFNIPIVTFIDTPGAFPSVGSETRGQAEAIASSIECCMSLNVPIISFIIGEGGSGGAIALASANKVLMLENAIYSVISPEGCASILWRDPSKSLEAAKAMKLTADELLKMKIIDEIIKEPIGGAHRNKDEIMSSTKIILKKYLLEFKNYSREEIFEQRKEKFLSIGKEGSFNIFSSTSLGISKNNLFPSIKKVIFKFKKEITIIIFLALIIGLFLL